MSKHNISLVFLLILWISSNMYSQKKFVPPVNYDLRLSGSFGELRKNHFHAGIDIKSSGNYNTNKVIAIMDGFVSRIKVGPDGYGKAVYIDHPNGLTSVYAHLNNFNKDLEKFVNDYQYKNQTFVIDIDSLNIPINKGEIIGQVGNTGRSFGPHLHFELRNTITENPINPFIYGFKPKDNRPPELLKLKIVALDTSFNELNSKIYSIKKSKKGNYYTVPNTISYGAWRIGIEVLGFDRMNSAPNKNGIYKMTMNVNGESVYGFKMDSLDYSTQNDLNAHIDYKEYLSNKSKYIRTYILPGNDLDIYTKKSSNYIVPLFKNKVTAIELIAEDYHGNKSILQFSIKRSEEIIDQEPKLFNHKLTYGKEEFVRNLGYYLNFNRNDLFKDMFLFLSRSNDDSEDIYSNDIIVFTNYEAFKNKVDLFILPLKVDSFADKMCIVKVEDDKYINNGNHIVDGYFHTQINSGGTYKVMIDTISPTIIASNFKYNMIKSKSISFKISDNFDTAVYAKTLEYNGYIDNEWVLFEYNIKTKKITHKFRKSLNKGKHHIKVVLKDDRNNTSVFENDFIR